MDSKKIIKQEAILAIDIGTTNLKCCLYSKNLELINSSCQRLTSLQPYDGCSELDPNHLLSKLKECLNSTLENNTEKFQIKCFGLSTQRNSFILWNRNTGKTYTKFILWNDKRNKETCKALNKGLVLNTLKKSSSLASKILTNHRLKTVSKLKVETTHIAPRLIDQLKILETKLESKEFEDISYGTIDTWLVWAIGKEKLFVTDITCACSSGFYDIFRKNWSDILLYVFQIPQKILPSVTDTCGDFGYLEKNFLNLGYEVPIKTIIGDTQSSLIAECGFETGDCVITLGTGSFISVTVGNKPIASDSNSSYPLAGYKYKDEQIFILHCYVSTAGIAIDWAKSIGLFETYEELDDILKNTASSNGVFFIPAFGQLEVIDADKNGVGSGFIGLRNNTTKAEMLRAIFESLSYLIKIRMDMIRKDLEYNRISLKSIRISGGVSRSEFICQFLCNLLEFPIEKSNFSYKSSAYGAAFLAGLGSKMFDNLDSLNKYRKVEVVYMPNYEDIRKNDNYETNVFKWKNALERFINWHKIF